MKSDVSAPKFLRLSRFSFLLGSIGIALLTACNKPAATFAPPEANEIRFPEKIVQTDSLKAYEISMRQTLADSLDGISFISAGPVSANQKACMERLGRLSKNKTFNIRFAIGYEDFSPDDDVSDLIERKMLKDALVRVCKGKTIFCGFELSSENSFQSVLAKKLTMPLGLSEKLVVTITTSSVSTSNSKNESDLEQVRKSRFATSQFIQAFEEDDVVLYWGHGRDGGGPDFAPPSQDAHLKPLYSKYRKMKRGYGLLISGLGSPYRRTNFVGLFGCNTTPASLDTRTRFPDVNFITSNQEIEGEDLVRGSFAFIESLLQGDCSKDFYQHVQSRLKAPDTTSNHQIYSAFGPFFSSQWNVSR